MHSRRGVTVLLHVEVFNLTTVEQQLLLQDSLDCRLILHLDGAEKL